MFILIPRRHILIELVHIYDHFHVAFHAHGRGIALARKLSFESVEYLGKGNQVLARLAPPKAAAPFPEPAPTKALA